MKLYRSSEVEAWPEAKVFRDQSWWGLVGVIGLMALMCLYLAAPNTGPTAPALVIIPGGLGLLLGTVLVFRMRHYLRKGNWLLRQTEDGLWINLRSGFNGHLPEAHETILYIPREEVAAICRTKEVRELPSYRGGYKDVYSYIDIYLAHEDTASIADILRRERRIEAPSVWRGGGKTHDYRVRVIDPPGIRLVWEWIKPGEEQALNELGKTYPITKTRNLRQKDWDELSEAEKEALIVELWEIGHLQQAVGLVRHHRQCSARRAKLYLEEKIDAVTEEAEKT